MFFGLLGAATAATGWGLQRSAKAFAAQNDRPSPAHVGRDALAFRGRFVALSGFGVRFLGARVDEEHLLLRITYEVTAADVTAEHEVRVPVPSDRLDEAREVAQAVGR